MAEQILYDITFEGLDESVQKTQRLNQQLIEQKEVVNQTKKEIKALENERKKEGQLTAEQSAKLEKLNKDLLNQQQGLKDINTERRASIKESENFNKALQSEIGSNEQLKGELAILTKRYNSLSAEQRDGSKAGQDLQAKILGITNKLKGNEKAIGDNRRNVGNYEEAITSALGKVNIMGVNLGQLTTQIKSSVQTGKALATSMVETATATTAQATATSGATVASGGFSKALKILRVALIATGIGAIVVALGSLIAAFASTQRGVDALNSVLRPLQFVFQSLIGVAQDLSFSLVDSLKNPKQIFQDFIDFLIGQFTNRIEGIKNQFLALGDLIGNVLKGDFQGAKEAGLDFGNAVAQTISGIEDPLGKLNKALSQTSNFFSSAWREGQKLDKQIKALEKSQAVYIVQLAKVNAERRQAELLAADETIGIEAQIKAQERAIELQDEQAKLELQRKQNEIEILKLKQSANDTDIEGNVELANLEAELINIEAQRDQQKRTNLTRLTTLRNKANKEEKDGIEEEEEAEEQKTQTVIDLIEQEIEADKKATNAKLTNLEFEKNKELDQEDLTNKQKLEIEKKFQQDKAQIELDALTTQAERIKRQLEPLTADASGGLVSPLTDEEEQKLKEQLNTINAEMQKINQTVNGVEGETEDIKLQNALGLDDEGMEKLFMSFDIIGSAISGLSDLMNSITERNKKALDEQVKAGLISQEEADKKLEQIEKKAFKRQKAFNLSNAIMQGVMAQARIWGEVPKVDFGASTYALSATSAALTAANIASIAAQKFATGGEVKGAGTKTSDSIPAMLSNGEYVVQADAVRGLGTNFLDMINSVKPRKFATGGLVTPQPIPTTSTNANRIGELTEQVQSQEIRVINVEQDFSSIQNRVRNVERAGTF